MFIQLTLVVLLPLTAGYGNLHLLIMQRIPGISFPEDLRFVVNIILHPEPIYIRVCIFKFSFQFSFCPFNLCSNVLDVR